MNKNTQLRFWHYLASIIIPAMLIVPSLTAILFHIAAEISFTQNELYGIKNIHQLNGITHTLQKIRGLNQVILQGDDTIIQAQLNALQTSLSDSFAALHRELSEDPFTIGEEIQHIQNGIGKIAHSDSNSDTPQVVFEKHTNLISQIVDIRWKLAVRSNLILDPVLDSYFLMDLVVMNFPDLEEAIGRARGFGSGLLNKGKTLSDVDHLRFEEQLGAIRNSLEGMKRSQHIILESLPQLQGLFDCFPKQLNPTLQRFLEKSNSLVFGMKTGTGSNDYFALGTQAIQASMLCSDLLRTNLMQRLENRLDELKKNGLLVTIGACFALILAIYFVTTFYRRNQSAFKNLLDSEHKNQAIVESAIDGIITIDDKGIIHSANKAVEDLFGYQPGELLGFNCSILMPSPHLESHDAYLQSYLASGIKRIIGYSREVVGVGKDGKEFPLELAVGEFRSTGKVFFTGILHDITERKKAKEALQNAYNELEHRVAERTKELQSTNQRLLEGIAAQKQAESGLRLAAKVFEHASEAIVITDAVGNIIDVNNAYSKITEFERREVLGKNPRISKSGRHDQEFYQQMWTAILSTGQWSGEIWDRRKSGTVYPKWLSINAVRDTIGETTNFVGIFSDISHIKLTEERLEQLAFYDPLTQLPNRMLFKDRVKHELDLAKRHQTRGAIFFIDLDRFKHVNDTLGHAAGDKLLVQVAERVTTCVRTSDTVARLGGDEFTVILVNLDNAYDAAPIAQKIIDAVSAPINIDGHQANVGASIGIATFPDDGDTYDNITKYADVAMYHAKESGRGTYKFFEAEMNAKSAKRAKMEKNLHTGLRDNEFLLHYQPKIEVCSGRIVGMEALVRWQRPDGMLISPLDFIPLAEETGLIVPLGKSILKMACSYNKTLLESGIKPLRVAVNLSGRQFQDKNLYKVVEAILEETGLSPELLDLEVTESMMMQDENQAIAILKRLRDIGLSISMDDFGTGYSSLSYLKRFPINALKIDQSFVRDLTTDSDDAAIVSAIVSMAKSLKLHVVAEGVEKQSQWDFLKDIDCHELQGYFISRPLEDAAFTSFVQGASSQKSSTV